MGETEDHRDKEALSRIREIMESLQDAGGGIHIYTPQDPTFREKYAGVNKELALQFDRFEMDEVSEILPGLTEPQQRVLDVAIRYWCIQEPATPRDINRLRH